MTVSKDCAVVTISSRSQHHKIDAFSSIDAKDCRDDDASHSKRSGGRRKNMLFVVDLDNYFD